MNLAKVVGSVVSTQKSESLLGRKLLLIQVIDSEGNPINHHPLPYEVAVDCVGAGDGELVLVTRGSSARVCLQDHDSATDLSVVAIVDSLPIMNA